MLSGFFLAREMAGCRQNCAWHIFSLSKRLGELREFFWSDNSALAAKSARLRIVSNSYECEMKSSRRSDRPRKFCSGFFPKCKRTWSRRIGLGPPIHLRTFCFDRDLPASCLGSKAGQPVCAPAPEHSSPSERQEKQGRASYAAAFQPARSGATCKETGVYRPAA